MRSVDYSEELNAIAELLIAHTPEKWSSVHVKYEVDDGYIGVDIWGMGEEHSIFLNVGSADTDLISEQFKRLRKKSVPAWKIANFTATATDKCHIDFQY